MFSAMSATISAESARPARLDAVDLLRGLVMVIMVLDHTRDFALAATLHFDPTDLTRTTPAIFLTRWITHFCAPVFVFLAGTGIALQRQRGKPLPELSWFLLTRGLWLVVLEFTVVRTGWLFNFDYHFLGVAQVIWAIGCGMIIMAALVRLPVWSVGTLGLAIVVLHDLLDRLPPQPRWPGPPAPGPGFVPTAVSALFGNGAFPLGHPYPIVFFGYAIVPWLGVMALGYAAGAVYRWPPAKRQRALLWAGTLCVLAFVAVRLLDGYGDPRPWTPQQSPLYTVLSFLNVNKYPPSLDYVLMTLGPALLALAWFERLRPTALSRAMITFGRVPMFFYLLQWPTAHLLALLAGTLAHKPTAYLSAPPFSGAAPPDAGFGLPMTYALWLLAIVILYPLCRWYAGIKRTHRWWWLSYI